MPKKQTQQKEIIGLVLTTTSVCLMFFGISIGNLYYCIPMLFLLVYHMLTGEV